MFCRLYTIAWNSIMSISILLNTNYINAFWIETVQNGGVHIKRDISAEMLKSSVETPCYANRFPPLCYASLDVVESTWPQTKTSRRTHLRLKKMQEISNMHHCYYFATTWETAPSGMWAERKPSSYNTRLCIPCVTWESLLSAKRNLDSFAKSSVFSEELD